MEPSITFAALQQQKRQAAAQAQAQAQAQALAQAQSGAPATPPAAATAAPPSDGTWTRVKAWWNGESEQSQSSAQRMSRPGHTRPSSGGLPPQQPQSASSRPPTRDRGASTSTSSPASKPVVLTPARRMPMSFMNTSSLALRASLSPPVATPPRTNLTAHVREHHYPPATPADTFRTPPPHSHTHKSTQQQPQQQQQQQQRPQPSQRSHDHAPSAVPSSSDRRVGSSARDIRPTPTRPRPQSLEDENPILIAGSPWWRHDQRDVDLLKQQVSKQSPRSSRASLEPSASFAAAASGGAEPMRQRDIFGVHPPPPIIGASSSSSPDGTPFSPTPPMNVITSPSARTPSSRATAASKADFTDLSESPSDSSTPLAPPSSSPASPGRPLHDSTEALRHRDRDVRTVDTKYKRKLRKECEPLVPPATTTTRATSTSTSSATTDDDTESPNTVAPLRSQTNSPSTVVPTYAPVQPVGSERFWYSVVLASWPKMLHSSLLHKMMERDGVPPLLRHKVWSEILGRRTHLASSATGATPSHHLSSMSSDIQRMHAEPSRRMSDATSTTSPAREEVPLSSSVPGDGLQGPVRSPVTPPHSTTTTVTTTAAVVVRPDQPAERCAFCIGDLSSSSPVPPSVSLCSCPLNAPLLLPLLRPSASAVQAVLEGFVATRDEEDGVDPEDTSSSGAYVQGMSYLAEVLLCSMPPVLAIDALLGLFEHNFFRSFLAMRVEDIARRFAFFEQTLALNAPPLSAHLKTLGIPADCYYLEFLATLCAKQLPQEWIARVWDGYMLHGELFILRVTIALMQLLQPLLLRLDVSSLVRALREPATLGVFELTYSVSRGTTTPSTPTPSSSPPPVSQVPSTTATADNSPAASSRITPRPVFTPIDSTPTTPTKPASSEEDDASLAAHAASIDAVLVSRVPPPSLAPPTPPMPQTAGASAASRVSSKVVASSSTNSSFWWWPFSSSSSSSQSASHFDPNAPMPHVAITSTDLLTTAAQVNVPQHIADYCRQVRWRMHASGYHRRH